MEMPLENLLRRYFFCRYDCGRGERKGDKRKPVLAADAKTGPINQRCGAVNRLCLSD